jgi:hypothetical protein
MGGLVFGSALCSCTQSKAPCGDQQPIEILTPDTVNSRLGYSARDVLASLGEEQDANLQWLGIDADATLLRVGPYELAGDVQLASSECHGLGLWLPTSVRVATDDGRLNELLDVVVTTEELEGLDDDRVPHFGARFRVEVEITTLEGTLPLDLSSDVETIEVLVVMRATPTGDVVAISRLEPPPGNPDAPVVTDTDLVALFGDDS